jgi:hypothetical protein
LRAFGGLSSHSGPRTACSRIHYKDAPPCRYLGHRSVDPRALGQAQEVAFWNELPKQVPEHLGKTGTQQKRRT